MGRPRRLYIPGTVVEISFRAQEGLPIPPSPIITQPLAGILARAQELYSVELCHFICLSNHMHMICVVTDPKAISDFMCYIKREAAVLINMLLGRRQRSIWAGRYDAPTVLDAEKLMERITYLYTNPQQANLVDTIEEYPHLSSWNAMLAEEFISKHKRLPKSIIPSLPRLSWTKKEASNWIGQFFKEVNKEHELCITPFSWKRCFPETSYLTNEELRAQIVERVRRAEATLRKGREGSVIGARKLIEETINAPHEPKKWGARSICLGTEKRIRKIFIGWYKDIVHEAAKMAEVVSKQRWFVKLPPGLFAPSGYLNANVVPWLVPSAWNSFGECFT